MKYFFCHFQIVKWWPEAMPKFFWLFRLRKINYFFDLKPFFCYFHIVKSHNDGRRLRQFFFKFFYFLNFSYFFWLYYLFHSTHLPLTAIPLLPLLLQITKKFARNLWFHNPYAYTIFLHFSNSKILYNKPFKPGTRCLWLRNFRRANMNRPWRNLSY